MKGTNIGSITYTHTKKIREKYAREERKKTDRQEIMKILPKNKETSKENDD